ncbi:MAG: hypothetical protein ACOVT5_06780, partial [Armatimonadaceae bacterium]
AAAFVHTAISPRRQTVAAVRWTILAHRKTTLQFKHIHPVRPWPNRIAWPDLNMVPIRPPPNEPYAGQENPS